MQTPNKKAAPFSFHQCAFYLSSLSLISQWILWTQTFISSHIVIVVIVLGVLAENVETGDEIIFAANNRRATVTECCNLKALFFFFLHTEMSSVFGTGQSMNPMAWKLVKWAKFVLVLTNTHIPGPTCLKMKNLREQNFHKGTVAHNCHGKKN